MPVNESQKSRFESRLQDELAAADEELEAIDEQIRSLGDGGDPPAPATNHPGDTADALTDRNRFFTIREDLRFRRSEIEHALEKLRAGEYGDCERCGKPIAYERLEALPFARHCIECQEIVEQSGAGRR